MNTSSGLCGRDTLHAVCAAFEFHFAVRAASVDHEDNLFEAAEVVRIHVHQLHAPALGIGITGIHPVQI
ncbi:hypothetical protein D3C86_2011540 [compost metagenome]